MRIEVRQYSSDEYILMLCYTIAFIQKVMPAFGSLPSRKTQANPTLHFPTRNNSIKSEKVTPTSCMRDNNSSSLSINIDNNNNFWFA